MFNSKYIIHQAIVSSTFKIRLGLKRKDYVKRTKFYTMLKKKLLYVEEKTPSSTTDATHMPSCIVFSLKIPDYHSQIPSFLGQLDCIQRRWLKLFIVTLAVFWLYL